MGIGLTGYRKGGQGKVPWPGWTANVSGTNYR
jgi:hypothetical protein